MVGILVSFWDGLFSANMLVSGRVLPSPNKNPGSSRVSLQLPFFTYFSVAFAVKLGGWGCIQRTNPRAHNPSQSTWTLKLLLQGLKKMMPKTTAPDIMMVPSLKNRKDFPSYDSMDMKEKKAEPPLTSI